MTADRAPERQPRGARLPGFGCSILWSLRVCAYHMWPWTLDGEYGGSHEINVVENCRQAIQIVQGE